MYIRKKQKTKTFPIMNSLIKKTIDMAIIEFNQVILLNYDTVNIILVVYFNIVWHVNFSQVNFTKSLYCFSNKFIDYWILY